MSEFLGIVGMRFFYRSHGMPFMSPRC